MYLVGVAVRTLGSLYGSGPKPEAMKDMLRTVLQVLDSPTCRLIKPHPTAQHMQTTSIASDVGWGGYLRNDQGTVTAKTQMLWTTEESALHSTQQETLGSARTVLALLHKIPPRAALTIRTDNICAQAAWNKGSSKWHINEPVRNCLNRLTLLGIWVRAQYVPGLQNVLADRLSREHRDQHNYQLRSKAYKFVCKALQFYTTLDLFMSDNNHKCTRFYSYLPSPKALGRDAFLQTWAGENFYANPPLTDAII